jgi:transposase
MQVFLDEIAPRYPNENVVMVLDCEGWHKSQEIELAENVRTLFLPPYSPELNPQEHVWDELREKFFHNRVFDSLDALETHLEKTLRCLESSSERRGSIAGWDWIINSGLTRTGIRLRHHGSDPPFKAGCEQSRPFQNYCGLHGHLRSRVCADT